MQRFVYAPKVEAFVMLEESRRLIDLSDDIINGSVNRRLNAMSDASLTLQNKNGKYTKQVKIEPMDRIVIRMSRVGQPFPVFSGFVDDAPFYQLYPGPVTLKASCTLKILQNTYFDPGLPFLTSYFAGLGWQYNPSTGVLFDVAGRRQGNLDISGGMGDVLWSVLKDIGGWPEEHIDIRDLPQKFINAIAKMRHDALEESDELYEEVVDLLERLFKTTTVSVSTDQAIPGSVGAAVHGNVDIVDVAKLALRVGFKGEGAVKAVAIAMAESSLRSNAMGWNTNGTYDVGLWQINTVHTPGGGSGLPRPVPGSDHYTFKMQQDWNKVKNSVSSGVRDFVENCFNPLFNAQQAYSISSQGTNFSPWFAIPTSSDYAEARKAIQQAALSAGSSGFDNSGIQYGYSTGVSDQPTQPVDRQGMPNPPYHPLAKPAGRGATPADHRARAFGNWQSDQATDMTCAIGTKVIAPVDGVVSGPMGFQVSGPYYRVINPPNDVVRASFSGNPSGQSLYLTVNSQQKYWFTHMFKIFVKEGQVVKAGDVLGLSGSGNGVPHLHFAVNTSSDSEVLAFYNYPTVEGVMPDGALSGVDLGGIVTDSAGNLTPGQVAQIATKAVFFQTQLTGGDTGLASILRGKRALANDISLMEWIGNLVPASGRVFCSKPNGDFLAFFPDHFGYFERTPYFRINDIEIVDLTINKNDTNLTTHVFTFGPTANWTTITGLDQATSMVASIEEAAFKKFVSVGEKDLVNQPLEFLSRFGARPFPNPMPNVTHPLLLWMAGWMKFAELWAKRFTAAASFTFMPELFPGGLIAMGDRIQMFIESVSHSFDMSGGFSTTAELSAPATLGNEYFEGLVQAGIAIDSESIPRQDRTSTPAPAQTPKQTIPMGIARAE